MNATLGDFAARPSNAGQPETNLRCPVCYHLHPPPSLEIEVASGEVYPGCPSCGYRYPSGAGDRWAFVHCARSQEELPRPDFAAAELCRRLPALSLIEDENVRQETIALTRTAPAYFWIASASSSGYHHALCREDRGLWIHTLMVATVVERLLDSYVEQGRLAECDRDLARAAAILHDQRKQGSHYRPASAAVSDHDLRMGAVIAENSDLPDSVATAVEEHMGPWYDGPAPETPLGELVHTADMVASTNSVTPKLPAPVPGELRLVHTDSHRVRGVDLS